LLGGAQLHELLLCCAGLNAEQLKGGMQLKVELFACLVNSTLCAAEVGFGEGPAVCKLVAVLIAGFPWEGSPDQRKAAEFGLHPVLHLLMVLDTDVLDVETVHNLLEAGISADRSNALVKAVLRMPAAAELSTDHIRQLAHACVLRGNGDALDLLLQQPSAPCLDDPDVQLCRSMLFS
jgi:hypothetical protein